MEFFFDTETTGFPERSGNRLPPPKSLDKYDSARIVSISWIVTRQQRVVSQAYYVVRPDGFVVPPESTAIHGITHEEAMSTGCPIATVFDTLKEALDGVATMVAHNIDFDIRVLTSELIRAGREDLVSLVDGMHHVCTMKKGREVTKKRAYPKLADLYRALYGEEMEGAHNAQYDTYYCFKCYTKMFPLDRSLFFFGNRPVNLTEAQRAIVYEEADKNLLVVACAGSGKTLTMICRIKHLIETGVPEESIMLTTFTRDAASDMKNKLFDIMGYTPAVTVGTIDSISRRFSNSETRNQLKNVDEHSHEFLKAITATPTLISKYRYLFVDEFQDINDVQYQIIRAFYSNGCRIFAVGDDAQNIYTFRGSKIEFILGFEAAFDNSRRMFLTENFRSTRQVIDLANACIEKNENSIPKRMAPGTDVEGPLPSVHYWPTAAAQNAFIVDQIVAHIAAGVPEHEIVVLSPINQPLFMIEELLTKKGVKNVYLDGKGDVKTSKRPWHVCLCTIHKSKGLEWEHVYMIGLSDEIIPKTKTPALIDESRRLFYVGITRARATLFLCYSVMVSKQPFVTRFVSELDRSLYTTHSMDDRCFGLSDMEFIPKELSVTKLIDNLDGGDYIRLRELGIIPTLEKKDFRRSKIYESFGYTKAVDYNDLYSDFGIFIEKLIKRDLAVTLGNGDLCSDKHSLMCLANIKLDQAQYNVYMQYRNNFKENLRRIRPLLIDVHGNKYKIKSSLEQNSKHIQEAHLPTLLQVLMQVRQRAEYFGIEPHQVPIFSKSFLPPGFEKTMERALRSYRATSDATTEEHIKDTWEIAKCKKIVTEYRRRLLYKEFGWDDLGEYAPLYANIRTHLMDFFLARITDPAKVATEEEFEVKEGMHGELDLRIGDTIIDYKTSINDDISMQWLLQLLCYKVLADHNGHHISRIGILNSLRGWYGEVDVSSWDRHHDLVDYLLKRREEKMGRN